MTYCIQGIVPEKTNQVGFCNVKIRAGGKLVTAFNQTLEKGTGLADMGKSTDILTHRKEDNKRKYPVPEVRDRRQRDYNKDSFLKNYFSGYDKPLFRIYNG